MRSQCRACATLLLCAAWIAPTSSTPHSPGARVKAGAREDRTVERTGRSEHKETRQRTVHVGSKYLNTTIIYVYWAMSRSSPVAPTRLQQGRFTSCLPMMPSEGSKAEKRIGEEEATRVREEQERVSPHQDVKADLAAVSRLVLCQRGRDRREGCRV